MSKDNMDRLLSEGIRVAGHFLGKSGEFFPFAVALTRDNLLRHVQGWTGEEQPPSSEVIDVLRSALTQGAASGEFCTVALISDVRIRPAADQQPIDAICVQVEDRDSGAVTCYVPYRAADRVIDAEAMMVERVEPTIFRP